MMAGAEVCVGQSRLWGLCTKGTPFRSLELKQLWATGIPGCFKLVLPWQDSQVCSRHGAVVALVGQLELVLAGGPGLTGIKVG